MNIYFIIQHYFIHFVALIVSALAIGSSFCWLQCSFDVPPSLHGVVLFCFLSTSLLSGTKRYSRIIMIVFCPVIESSISQGLLLIGE